MQHSINYPTISSHVRWKDPTIDFLVFHFQSQLHLLLFINVPINIKSFPKNLYKRIVCDLISKFGYLPLTISTVVLLISFMRVLYRLFQPKSCLKYRNKYENQNPNPFPIGTPNI